MRKFLLILCYILLVMILGSGSIILSENTKYTDRQMPYMIVWLAFLIRCIQILRQPKDDISFWKRLTIGLIKSFLCLFLAVCISGLLFDWSYSANGWLFCILFIISLVSLKSKRVLGWFEKKVDVQPKVAEEGTQKNLEKSTECTVEDVDL